MENKQNTTRLHKRRLRSGITTPLVVVGYMLSLRRIAIQPITAKRDVIHKTGST